MIESGRPCGRNITRKKFRAISAALSVERHAREGTGRERLSIQVVFALNLSVILGESVLNVVYTSSIFARVFLERSGY